MKTAIAIILAIISLANAQLDKPYSYGKAGPNSYDCSGLVYYCFLEEADIELPRTAKEIGYCEDYITIETIEELEKGDIVCFNTNRSDGDLSDHVGIYLGDHDFIHSSSAQGKVVISTLGEGYYNERFSWGKRVILE